MTHHETPDGVLASGDAESTPLDALAEELQRLRADNGSPSYAEIANRIRRRRTAAGAPESAARVARGTVYGCFQAGRSRINAELVGEIAVSLTGNEASAEEWARRSGLAQVAMERRALGLPIATGLSSRFAGATDELDDVFDKQTAESISPDEVFDEARPPALEASMSGEVLGATPVQPLTTTSWTDANEQAIDQVQPLDRAQPPDFATASFAYKAWLTVFLALLNVVFVWTHQRLFQFGFPLHLDMIAIAIVAMLFGPGWGILAVAVTIATYPLWPGVVGFPTGLALIPGALLWGYGVGWWKASKSLRRYIVLNLVIGLLTSIVAVAALQHWFGNDLRHAANQNLLSSFVVFANHPTLARFTVNLITNLVDKLVTGLIALLLIDTLFRRFASPDLQRLVRPQSISGLARLMR